MQERELQQEGADKKQEKKKAPKPKAVTGVSEDKILCPECGEPLAFEGELQQEGADKKQEKKKAPKPKAVTGVSEDKILCPECGEPLAFEGGCNVCKNCGWSKCY